MKRLLLIALGLVTALVLLGVFQYTSKARSTQIVLAQITYNTDAEFEIAFDGSTSVHYYYETPTGTKSYMLSRLTMDQYNRLLARGFSAEILENNPRMSDYMIIYTPQVVPKESFVGLVETQNADEHFSLVKKDSGSNSLDYHSLVDPDIATFEYEIEKPLAKPPSKTVRIDNPYGRSLGL